MKRDLEVLNSIILDSYYENHTRISRYPSRFALYFTLNNRQSSFIKINRHRTEKFTLNTYFHIS